MNERQLSERMVLVEFFNETNGVRWRDSSNWTTSISHCCWYGIVCNSTTGLVEELQLVSNKLSGQLPSSVFRLSSLKILMLKQNGLSGNLDNILVPNVTELHQLGLSSNSFEGQIPWNTLSTYRSLRKIQLSDNMQLGGKIGETLAKLKNLEVLSLGHTSVRGQVPKAIKSLKRLWFLDLEMLRLEGNISFLEQLPSLSFVHLRSNKLVGELPAHLGTRLTHLEELHLSGNSLSGKLPDSFHMTVNLVVVNIASNQFHGQIPSSLLQLKSLLYLDVSSNQFNSVSSNLSLPGIQFLVLANNPIHMTPTNLINTLLKMKNRTGLRILDISSCRLTGHLPQNIWMFTNIMLLKLSNNSFYGNIPEPIVRMYYLIAANFSNNNFNGSIPQGFFSLDAIQTFDLRNNEHLISSSMPKELPWFTFPDPNTRTREFPSKAFTCPTIRFNNTDAGILLINSSYYHSRYCACDPGFYGHSGWCLQCPIGGLCRGGNAITVIEIQPNYYPSPSPHNMTALVRCSSFYQDTFRCNPEGTCSCTLSSDGTTTACETHCTCAYNSTGRLCSQCLPDFYRYGDVCVPCSDISSTKAVVVSAAVVVAILIIVWLLSRIQPKCISLIALKAFNIGAIIFQTGLVLALGITKVIPAYVAEFYILMVVLALFDHLANIKVLALILLVYFQVLNSLNISSQSVDCQHCSFAHFLNMGGIAKVVQAVNFHFNGVTCSFPFLSSPIGRLATLAAAPLAVAFTLFLGRLIDHYLLVRLCTGKNEDEVEQLRQAMANNSKSNVIFLLNVFYYPIARESIMALLPCEKAPGDTEHYMIAYPWISCSSLQYHNLIILAGFVTALYVCLVPIFFLALLRKYTSKRQATDNATKIRSQSSSHYEEEAVAWLNCLCSVYKTKYQTWISVLLMLRRLTIAIVLASFNKEQADAQSFVLTIILTVSITFIAVMRPYQNTTSLQLESVADVGAFSVILVIYSSISSRSNASLVTASFAFSLNVLYIAGMAVAAIGQLVYIWHVKRNKGRTVMGKRRHYTELAGDNTSDASQEHSFSMTVSTSTVTTRLATGNV